jgi:hypothetical protein
MGTMASEIRWAMMDGSAILRNALPLERLDLVRKIDDSIHQFVDTGHLLPQHGDFGLKLSGLATTFGPFDLLRRQLALEHVAICSTSPDSPPA